MSSNILILLYITITSAGLLLLKIGSQNQMPVAIVDGRIIFNLNPHLLIGVLLYGISFVLYMFLIAKYDLGYIIPLVAALMYIILFVASYYIFHETFTAYKIAGIILIILGALLLNVRS